MYYSLAIREPVRLAAVAHPHTIWGLPAESFLRIAAPLTMGTLSAVGLILSVRGRERAGAAFLFAGIMISSIVAAGQAAMYEQQAGRIP